ncbi:MAG: hypothetical protein CME62_00285 [Halobacteriovoraceae bacterium]|nr:hypothetical protein [Halobacteriovoraceae bacterium]
MTFHNNECEQTSSCDLKEFTIKVYKARSKYGSAPFSYNVMMEGYYETKSLDTLTDFAIVQFIKGALVETGRTSDFTRFGIRKFFGKKWQPFHHPEWQIDSLDEDPIYASFIHEGVYYRHGAYQLNPKRQSILFEDVEEMFYLNHKPTTPRLYFSDLPTGSSVSKSLIRESELEFRTCIYKTKNIPQDIGPDDVDFAEPIQCFEWEGKFPYNPETGQISQ